MQARLALEHGKRLFLPGALVQREEWARTYAARRGVTVVSDVADILDELAGIAQAPRQLTLSF
jgi:DNA processing protein